MSVVKINPRADVVYYGALTLARKGDEATAARFSQAVRAMREDGTLRRIFTRHTDAERAERDRETRHVALDDLRGGGEAAGRDCRGDAERLGFVEEFER